MVLIPIVNGVYKPTYTHQWLWPTLATLGAKHLEGVDRKPERHWVLRVVGPGRRAGLGDGQLQFSWVQGYHIHIISISLWIQHLRRYLTRLKPQNYSPNTSYEGTWIHRAIGLFELGFLPSLAIPMEKIQWNFGYPPWSNPKKLRIFLLRGGFFAGKPRYFWASTLLSCWHPTELLTVTAFYQLYVSFNPHLWNDNLV